MTESKHTLAVLRKAIGYSQKQMAGLLGCSQKTVEAIEYLKLPLGGQRGAEISTKTGVGLDWLMAGDPTKPILSDLGLPYTKEYFEKVRAQLADPDQVLGDFNACMQITPFLALIGDILLAGQERGEARLAAYKLKFALEEIRRGFTSDTSYFQHMMEMRRQSPHRRESEIATEIIRWFIGLASMQNGAHLHKALVRILGDPSDKTPSGLDTKRKRGKSMGKRGDCEDLLISLRKIAILEDRLHFEGDVFPKDKETRDRESKRAWSRSKMTTPQINICRNAVAKAAPHFTRDAVMNVAMIVWDASGGSEKFFTILKQRTKTDSVDKLAEYLFTLPGVKDAAHSFTGVVLPKRLGPP